MLTVSIPGRAGLRLSHAVFDLNGTLTLDGHLLPGVAERLSRLTAVLSCHILTADTLGKAQELAAELNLPLQRVHSGADKLAFVESLGPAEVVAVGNGANDAAMLGRAALGIAVLGPEGAAPAALAAAALVVPDIAAALDLLLHPARLAAGLRP